MTRLEAEADVRRIPRTCRGHWVFESDAQAILQHRWQQIEDVQSLPQAVVFKTALEQKLGMPPSDIPFDFEQVKNRVSSLIFGCKEDCGYDVNEIICRYPFDGADHEVPCPQCGTTQTFSVFYDL